MTAAHNLADVRGRIGTAGDSRRRGSCADLRLRPAVAVVACFTATITTNAAADAPAPQRMQLATGIELVGTTGQFNDVFLGPYARASYKPTGSFSFGAVGGYGIVGTNVGDGMECSSGSQRHLGHAALDARAHSRVAYPLELWAGAEAGIGVMHSVYTESCSAGFGGPFVHTSTLNQVAPMMGPALGASVLIGRYVSVDLTGRGWVAFFPADDRPGAEALGTRGVLSVGVGASFHFSP